MYQIIVFSYYPKEDRNSSVLFSNEEIQRFNRQMSRSNNADEWIVWSTPTHTEIIVLANFQRIVGILSDLGKAKGFSLEKIKRLFTVRTESNGSLEYLAVISLGLKAAVFSSNFGRENISKAYKFACEEGTVGNIIGYLIKSLFRMKQEVYAGEHVEAIRKSIAQSGVYLVSDYLSIFRSPKVAIIGFDSIGQNLALMLIQRGIKQLSVFDRHADRVHAFFADQTVDYELKDMRSFASQLDKYDLVFSSISQTRYIITKSTIYQQKSENFHLLVDLSYPKSIDPQINEKMGVIRMGLEDIQKESEFDNVLDKGLFTSVKKVIDSHLQDFLIWKKERFYLEIVNELRAHLIAVKQRELEKISKNIDPHGLPKKEMIMDKEIQELVNQSLTTLKSANNECQRQAYLGLISQMFLS